MSARVGAGISFDDTGVDAFAEAVARAALALGGGPADLALVFAGPGNLEHVEEGVAAVHERLRPAALSGCGAQGVVGAGRELESGGVCVWAASFEGGEAEQFHAEAIETDDSVTVAGMPELGEADGAILLADPYTFPAEPLLGALAEEHPGVPVVGGLASGGPGPAALLDADGPVAGGAVGAVLRGVELRPCVSQGARPVGPEMTVTAAEGNVIQELASRPALERLKEAITELDPHERALAAGGLLMGIVVDQNKPDYERGDFLVRGLAGVEEETGSLAVAATARVGQTVRMHVRDAASAHEDLMHALDQQLESLGGPPAGALLFTCNGRGAGMFGVPDHDAGAVAEAFANAPTAGFFCAGEIGPVGGRSFVHGFTATIAAFPA
jgi:small ligand-binding sensory domain FIST